LQLALLNRFQAAIGMAFETIDLYAGVKVAAGTKMLWVGVADCGFSALGRVVAIHATDQAVLTVAFTVLHRGIALMQQKIHVIPTHDVDRCHTTAGIDGFGWLWYGDRTETRTLDLSCRCRRQSEPANKADQQHRR